MKNLYDFSNVEISLIFIGGALLLALLLCLGLCGFLHSVSRQRRRSSSSSHSKNGLIKEQSQSVLRGDHPIAFVLPTVSHSEPGSEFSDLESLTTYSTSPSITLTSPRGSHTPWRRFRAQHQQQHQRRSRQLPQAPAAAAAAGAGGGAVAAARYRLRRSASSRRRYTPLIDERELESESTGGSSRAHSRAGTFRGYTSETGAHSMTETGGKRVLELRGLMGASEQGEQGEQSKQIEQMEMSRSRSATTSPRNVTYEDEEDSTSEKGSLSLQLHQVSASLSPESSTPMTSQGEAASEILGKLRLKLRLDGNSGLVISEIFITDFDPTGLKGSKVSVKVKIYPDYQSVIETGMTSVFDDKILLLDPVELPIDNIQTELCVLRLSVLDKVRSGRKPWTFAHALINLQDILPLRDNVTVIDRDLKKSVSEELTELFSDSIELSLTYEPEPGKLTLGIIQAKVVCSKALPDLEASLYSKVTLFEGRRVIKAKKTRPVGCTERPQFHETFSILFPKSYLDKVSCIISLCSKNKQGTKYVLGRICIGPGNYADGRGLQHWTRMVQNSGATIIQWHHLK